MSKRIEYWKTQGYTDEQIECHLQFERNKAKKQRERRKRNNVENQEIIKKIKDDLLGKTFDLAGRKITVISLRPTVDGVGCWIKYNKIFEDGSSGDFREFIHFSDYNKEEILESITY